MSKRKLDRPQRVVSEAAPAHAWLRRSAVLAAGAIVLVFTLLLAAGPSWLIVLSKVFTDGLIVIAWLIAAGGYGSLVALPRIENENGQPNLVATLVTRIALGIGILSLLQLCLGLAGLLGRGYALVVIASGLIFAAARISTRRIHFTKTREWLAQRATFEWLWLLALPLLSLAFVAALVPAGVMWGDEPHGYDVVEYHLQLPREWYELHRIVPLHHNVFSYFPLATEMHYLFAMQLCHNPWAGMYVAQLMHVAMCALAVVAVYAMGSALGSRASAIVGAVFAATVPWITLLAPMAYNEGGLLLFGTLSVGWAICAMRSEKSLGSWAIAGAFAGFACGVKLTAAPMLLAAVPIVALIVTAVRREQIRRALIGGIVFVIVGTALFSPWLIRNVIWTRNPVFPEGQDLFGHAHFSQVQAERWRLAHSPPPAQRPLTKRLAAFADQILVEPRFGFLLMPIALLAPLISWRRSEAWFLAGMIALLALFWVFFTHLQGRFFVLAIPLAGLLIAQLRDRRAPLALTGILIIQFFIAANILVAKFIDRAGPFRDNRLLAVEDLSGFLPQDVEDAKRNPDASFALVGDARAFLYQIPTSRLSYRTVFDVDVKPGQSIVDAWLGDRTGSPIIVIDPIELDRFSKTYYGIPPLPQDFPGPRDRAYILTPHP